MNTNKNVYQSIVIAELKIFNDFYLVKSQKKKKKKFTDMIYLYILSNS